MRILISLGCAALCLATPAMADEVVVFAAASLKSALDEVAADFTAQTGHTVTLSYGGSNQLARQIIAGAPADIFLSAAENWMDEVEKSGLVENRVDLWGNALVLIAPGRGTAPMALAELPERLTEERLAMALVDAVPVGQYGKAALTTLGLWDKVAPHVVQADNARAALALVAMREAVFGVVYATDAAAEDEVSVVATFPEASHPPIRYPGALLTEATDAADAEFMQFLSADAADARFRGWGFQILH